MMETVINFVIFILGEVSFYAYAQRKRLGVVGELEFRQPITEAQ
jgi:hypothetical protein